MSPTPNERRMIASLAAHERWARTPDRAAALAPARRGLDARFAREVDPEGKLPPAERARLVASARSAFYKRITLKSAQDRRARAAGDAA